MKMVRNPSLFLHHWTFTMHRLRVHSINQWWRQHTKRDGCLKDNFETWMLFLSWVKLISLNPMWLWHSKLRVWTSLNPSYLDVFHGEVGHIVFDQDSCLAVARGVVRVVDTVFAPVTQIEGFHHQGASVARIQTDGRYGRLRLTSDIPDVIGTKFHSCGKKSLLVKFYNNVHIWMPEYGDSKKCLQKEEQRYEIYFTNHQSDQLKE